MNKQRVVMNVRNTHELWVELESSDGVPNLAMNRIDWEDMGEPESVTVTIRPGDRLN